MKIIPIAVVILSAAVISRFAQAKEGPSLGLDLGARVFTGDIRNATQAGPAVGFVAGWGLTDSLDLRFRWDGSLHTGDDLGTPGTRVSNFLMGPNLGLGYSFLPWRRLQPYLDAGIGVYWFGRGGGMMSGTANAGGGDSLVSWGVLAGAGFNYYLRNDLSIGPRLQYVYVRFPRTSVTANDVLNGANLAALVNLSFHFGQGAGHCPMCGMMHPMAPEAGQEHGEGPVHAH